MKLDFYGYLKGEIMVRETFCGIDLFEYEKFVNIEADEYYFHNVTFYPQSMQKYNGMNVSRFFNGRMKVWNKDKNGEEVIWSGYVTDIREVMSELSKSGVVEETKDKALERKKTMFSKWINKRKESGEETTPCMFLFTTPKIQKNLEIDENIKILTDILEKYGITWGTVDTVSGSYNLDREWIETNEDIHCYIEYSGVYPVEWDIEDIIKLEELDKNGNLIIKVSYHIGEDFIPNH